MQKFKDVNGLEWSVDLNLATVKALRDKARNVESLKDVDFLDYAGVLSRLQDVFFCADLLFLIVEDQAAARCMTAADFGRALRGEELFHAVEAFTAEYLDFFPDRRSAAKMEALLNEIKKSQESLEDLIVAAARREVATIRDDLATTYGEPSLNG